MGTKRPRFTASTSRSPWHTGAASFQEAYTTSGKTMYQQRLLATISQPHAAALIRLSASLGTSVVNMHSRFRIDFPHRSPSTRKHIPLTSKRPSPRTHEHSAHEPITPGRVSMPAPAPQAHNTIRTHASDKRDATLIVWISNPTTYIWIFATHQFSSSKKMESTAHYHVVEYIIYFFPHPPGRCRSEESSYAPHPTLPQPNSIAEIVFASRAYFVWNAKP